ncbi:hypothetical protein [Rhodococcus sp. RDE2]|nr:hypothetical protein [Rhodococcus sp. RDE2]
MNSFDDLVGRELAHRKATETEQREMRARADVAAAEGAAAISALLRELAEFLSSRLAPRPVFLEKGPWYGRDKVTPAGWILK